MTDRVELPLSGAAFGADPSFVELLRRQHPEALPSSLQLSGTVEVAQGTTVLGLRFADGIVMAGDRRATAGYTIADAKMKKVFAADDFSAIAIAGAAGQAVETVRLFQLELEHYEKLTGDRLSLEGKANRLAQMIRANFPLAVQGLVVVPLFGGYDVARSEGRLFYYDATGGSMGGRGLPGDGLGGAARQELPEEALAARVGPRRGDACRGRGADRRRGGRRRDRGARISLAASSRSS